MIDRVFKSIRWMIGRICDNIHGGVMVWVGTGLMSTSSALSHFTFLLYLVKLHCDLPAYSRL